MDRKKKQILKCALKKSRLKAPFFSPFFLASFFCSYRKEQNDCGVQLQVKGVETGNWIDLNTFTDFHGGHLTFEKGGWGRDKGGGVLGGREGGSQKERERGEGHHNEKW